LIEEDEVRELEEGSERREQNDEPRKKGVEKNSRE